MYRFPQRAVCMYVCFSQGMSSSVQSRGWCWTTCVWLCVCLCVCVFSRRLQSVYGILRKMRFFKHFALYKAFNTWRATAKRINYQRIREIISRELLPAVGAVLFAHA